MNLFTSVTIIEAIAIIIDIAGLIAIVAYTVKRQPMGKYIFLPFLYSTISFYIWVLWQGIEQSISQFLISLIALNVAVGVILFGAFIQIRAK